MKLLFRVVLIGVLAALIWYLGHYVAGEWVEFGNKEQRAQPIQLELPPEQDDSADTVAVPKGVTLDLSGRALTKTPEYVFGETHIEKLDLSNNELSGALQAEVRHLANLKVLDLSDNNFTGVPAEVGQLAQLEVLDLSNNQLTGLPHELGNLKKLKTLDLRGNDPSEFDLDVIKKGIPNAQILIEGDADAGPVACTMDAKICPDGTAVGRVGPNCEFAPCPAPQASEGTLCKPEQRNVDACIEIYQPVCGLTQVECITEPCDPVPETYSNSCFACQNDRVVSYTEGACS